MVCQLDSTNTSSTTNADSPATTATTTTTSTPIQKEILLNRTNRSSSQLLTSLSLTLLTNISNSQARRTSSTILNKQQNFNENLLIKNSISLDNLEQQQQQNQQQQQRDEFYNQINDLSNEYLNENTLVNSLPDLDSLVLNKCYLFNNSANNKDFKSTLSLSNKNDLDDDDFDVDDDDEDMIDDTMLNSNHKTATILSSSSSSSSAELSTATANNINQINETEEREHQQEQVQQQQFSTSPSLSISLSNDSKSINSSTIDEFNSRNQQRKLLVAEKSNSPSLSSNFISSSSLSTSPVSHEHMIQTPPIITNNKTILPLSVKTLNPNYLAADIVSISSMTSNYSQFDFLNEPQQQSQPQQLDEKKSNSFSAFFNRFTSLNKNKSLNTLKQKNLNDNNKTPTNTSSTTTTTSSLFSGAFKLFQSSGNTNSNNNNSSNNENKVFKSNSDYTVPSTVLILENRPSNLPAKSNEEALKHKQEYEKMVEIAKKKEQKEKELKLKKSEQQSKKEDFMANSLKIWNTEILPNWDTMKNEKRTQKLWWHGLPPSIRGKVWKLAIGNELNLNEEQYHIYVKKAQEKIEILSRRSSDHQLDLSINHESSVELIKLDVSRTFPQLCFFQRDGPYHDALHNVLGAYACYNSKIGYVQGMSFLAAILLLNMESSDAFICLSNLLNSNYLVACFRMDQYKMNCYFKIHEILFEYNIPKLFRHFEKQKIKPDLYLIEWIFTLFSKSLPLDVVSRVWDVYLRDKEEFLFRTALGILNLYKDVLLDMDFENIVNFLTKLPEDINSTQLFKSIENMKTCLDNENLKFDDLVAAIVG